MIMCLFARKRRKKGVCIYHLDTHAIWKRFENDVKRKTHIFEGIFIDPFDNDNPSDHPLSFVSGVVTTSAVKESLRKSLDKGSQVSINFTKKHLIPSENYMPLKSYYDSLPKSDIKSQDRNAKDSLHPIQQSNNQRRRGGKDQETIQSSITPDQGYHMGK